MRLELSTYMVPETLCKANPDHFSCENVRVPVVETTIRHFFSESPDEILIFLTIKNTNDFADEDPYEFEIEMFGTFKVEYDENEGREELIHRYPKLVINGAQMLYSGARDYLHTVSGKGPYGSVKLPSAYMSEEGIEFRLIEREE